MKYLLLISYFGLIILPSYAVLAENMAQNICQYVAVDDKKRLRIFLKSKRIKIRKIFDDITCDGKNLVAFAETKSAMATADFLISKLPKKKVNAIIATLSTAEVLMLAKKRLE